MGEIRELIKVIDDNAAEAKWYSMLKCAVVVQDMPRIVYLPACYLNKIGKIHDVQMDESAYTLGPEDKLESLFSKKDAYENDVLFKELKEAYYSRIDRILEKGGYTITEDEKEKMAILLRVFNYFGADDKTGNDTVKFSLLGVRNYLGQGKKLGYHYENMIFDNFWDNKSRSFNCDKIGPCAPLDGQLYSWGWQMVAMFYSMLWINYDIDMSSLERIATWLVGIDSYDSVIRNEHTELINLEKAPKLSWKEYLIVYIYIQNKRRFWTRNLRVFLSVYEKIDVDEIKKILITDDVFKMMVSLSAKYRNVFSAEEKGTFLSLFDTKGTDKCSRFIKEERKYVYEFIFPNLEQANKSKLKLIKNNIDKVHKAYMFHCFRILLMCTSYNPLTNQPFKNDIEEQLFWTNLLKARIVLDMAVEFKIFFLAKKWGLPSEMMATSKVAKEIMVKGFNHDVDGFNNVLGQAADRRGGWSDFSCYDSSYYMCTLPIRRALYNVSELSSDKVFEAEANNVRYICKSELETLDDILEKIPVRCDK